jgi:hypothetical protein
VIFILGDLVLGIYLVFWCESLLRNIYWSMVSKLPCAKLCSSSSKAWSWSLTLFFSLSIEWSYRNVNHLLDNASQVPRSKVPPPPSIGVRGDWIVRCVAPNPWNQYVRHVTDDEKSISIYFSKSRLPLIGNFILSGKSPNSVDKRCVDPNSSDSKDQVSRKSISWRLWPVGISFNLSHLGGMRRCSPVGRISRCFQLCSRKPYVLIFLSYVCMPVWYV